jgi:signal transduction histidine kinase
MPVRFRITLIFSILVFIILSLVCSGIYYFSYQARINTIKTRLTNRAITTARLLSQREIFDRSLIQRIDSSTTIALKDKVVQAYDYQNRRIYRYSDVANDTLQIDIDKLDETRLKGSLFFISGDKEAVAYYYVDSSPRIVIIVAGKDEEGKSNLKSLFRILMLSFMIGNVFVIIVGYLFSRGLLLPILKISKDVAEISAQNLARRIETGKTKDEWYQLSITLNELLNRLQESFDLQRRFISNASHELSTPLTSISSQIEVALQRKREAGDYENVMRSIYQDVKHMSKLTQTLLEFAKASGDKGGLEINLIRIDEIILGIPAEMAKINSSYSVSIHFEQLPEDEESLLVFGNETLLATAIKNVVLNACKYSDKKQAKITLQVISKEIVVSVIDEGRGIPETELKTIFQPFYRVEDNLLSEGFGLGLSLSERIIKIHKGHIEVRSELGKGTTFDIYLPGAKYLVAS